MRKLLPLTIVLALTACAPALLSPRVERDGDAVVVTVVANAPAYAVTLSVLNVTSDDERCVALGPDEVPTDIGCILGDLGEGGTTTVTAVPTGPVACVAFGFSDPDLSPTSYRPYPCSAGQEGQGR